MSRARTPLPFRLALILIGARLPVSPVRSQAQFTAPPGRVEHVTVPPRASLFRFRRAIAIEPNRSQPATTDRACANLDAQVYAHAEPGLSDLRLYSASVGGLIEVPYALTTSDTTFESDAARVLNLGIASGHLSFDLAMPPRAYTAVDLDLAASNYLGTATVTGIDSPGQPAARRPVLLGRYTVFDLTAQQLGRSTRLPLPESTFPYLHIELSVDGSAGHPAPALTGLVRDAHVPPDREAQTLYTTVAESRTFTSRPVEGRSETVASFDLPARVPVEQIEFLLSPGSHTNFSRQVRISVTPRHATLANGEPPEPAPEILSGEIAHIQITEGGRKVDFAQLALPATIGLNADSPAVLEVAILNGNDQPLPLAAVRLAMRQRKLCFDAPAAPPTLFYGADRLTPAIYDYSRLFSPSAPARTADLAPEQPNPIYKAPLPIERPYTERHPELLWLALLAAIAVLGTVAFRSAKHR